MVAAPDSLLMDKILHQFSIGVDGFCFFFWWCEDKRKRNNFVVNFGGWCVMKGVDLKIDKISCCVMKNRK